MDRIHAIEREKSRWHEGKRTWDIFHVWPTRTVRDGVVFTSTVHVYVAEPGHPAAQIGLWVPGGPGGSEHEVSYGAVFWAPVKGWGLASVVSFNDVPLTFFWELSPGKWEESGLLPDEEPPPDLPPPYTSTPPLVPPPGAAEV